MNSEKDFSGEKRITFVDLSTMVEGKPGRGHLHDFHKELRDNTARVFSSAVIGGSIEEANELVSPVFQSKHFKRGMATFFPIINMNSDLKRVNSLLDELRGIKVLHFYEGGFRELAFLTRILRTRTDVISIFNFFSLDPWFPLVSRTNPFGWIARRIVRNIVTRLRPITAFTFDSEMGLLRFRKALRLDFGSVYPLFSSINLGSVERPSWANRGTDFLFAPRTRSEKKLVIETLKAMSLRASQRISVTIISRWTSSFNEGKLSKVNLGRLDVSVKNGALSKTDYAKLFSDTKVVVLPYLDGHYVLGSSGKVLDAQLSGCLIAGPSWNTAGRFIEENKLGVTFKKSPSSLSSALFSINLLNGPETTALLPDSNWAVSQIRNLMLDLKPQPLGSLTLRGHLWLPLLVGPMGFRWLLIHLVASPIKAALERLKTSV